MIIIILKLKSNLQTIIVSFYFTFQIYYLFMKKNIIDGYHGIMSLDLTNIDKKYHKNLISEHNKNIEEYKLEQEKLPYHLKYENCVQKIYTQLEKEDYHRKKRKQKEQEEKYKKYNCSFS